MKFLTLSSLFPPDVIGGAEACAYDLACWLKHRGHDSAVLTTASSRQDERSGELVDGLNIYRRSMPRPYPTAKHQQASRWQKPIWHLQDYLDPRNRRVVASVLDETKPDAVLVHLVPGLGFNALKEIAARDVPVVYFLHDLGLACVRGSMFHDGKTCSHRCPVCWLTSAYKTSILRRIPRLGFCSPSQAMLDRAKRFVREIRRRPSTVVLNASVYPRASHQRSTSGTVRLVYAGRLHATKGVGVLLEAVARVQELLVGQRQLSITIVGNGPEQAALRTKYEAFPWCKFTGFVSQAEVANIMIDSDLLCVPSLWFENSPGVVVQALGLGLPVLASDVGGLPELVKADDNGCLVPPGDVRAWVHALEGIVREPGNLERWRMNAQDDSYRFDQDHLGNKILEFAKQVCYGSPAPEGQL